MNNSNKHGKSKEIVEKLLGSSIICTLADGRTAQGKLVCVDRMSNIILTDCKERRQLSSADYNEHHDPDGGGANPPVTREVTRNLRQAMVPGAHLIKIEIDQSVYQEKVGTVQST